MSGGRGFGGNREVPPAALLGLRDDRSAAGDEAYTKEGRTRRKHGFPHGSEAKARDAHRPTCGLCAGGGSSGGTGRFPRLRSSGWAASSVGRGTRRTRKKGARGGNMVSPTGGSRRRGTLTGGRASHRTCRRRSSRSCPEAVASRLVDP